MRLVASSARSAFTLIDLLTTIGVILLLMSVLVAAVQRVREAGNRASCSNNLHQIGLALHQHALEQGVLPHNGGWDKDSWILSVNGTQIYVSTNGFNWGVGRPDRSPYDQPGSWAYAILPYIEQETMHRNRVWTSPVKLYACPSRRAALAQVPANDALGVYEGGGWAWGKIDYAANGLVMGDRPRCLRLADLRDGTASTILVGEKGMDVLYYTLPGWYYDEPFFLGGSHGTYRTRALLQQDLPGLVSGNRWGSAHPAGAEFLFGDGSVRLVRYDISEANLWALMTPSGREVVSEDF